MENLQVTPISEYRSISRHPNLTHDLFPSLLLFLFVLCLTTLALGQFSVLYKFGQGTLYAFDLAIAVFNVIGILYLLAIRKSVKVTLPMLFLISFCALAVVSLIFTPLSLSRAETTISTSYLVRLISYIIFGLVVSNLIRLDVLQSFKIQRVIIYSGLFLFAAGIIQLAVLPDMSVLDPSLGWDPHQNRMSSTFFDPNFLGMYFVLCLALSNSYRSSSLVIANPLKADAAIPLWMATPIFLFGILLTFSRSAWLAASVLILCVGLRKKILLVSALAVFVLAVFAVPRIQTRITGITDPQDSATYRLISWRNTWEIAEDNLIIGVGYNTFRYAQQGYGFLDDSASTSRSGAGSDSSLLLVLATTGAIGLFFFGGYFALILGRAIQKRDMVRTGLLIGLLVDSLFINSLFYPQILVVLVAAEGLEPSTSAM